MNTFRNAVNRNVNSGFTENGMNAYRSTGTALLDLFSEMGNYRDVMNQTIVKNAYNENPVHFARLLFFNRNVRGGQKVRRMLQYVLKNIDSFTELKNWLSFNLEVIPHFGYWKDFYNLKDTTLWNDVIVFWCAQLVNDQTVMIEGNQRGKIADISLAAKFAPSERNGANDFNKYHAREFAEHMNISPKQYRKMISALRSHLNIVEKLMSEHRWNEINFNQVPSVAMNNYKNAFKRHAEKSYNEWLLSDDTKVNVTGLTPVDIVKGYGYVEDPFKIKQWQNLPELENDWNVFPVIDCSGSMSTPVGKGVTAMDVSRALGLYFAHRLKGPFKNLLMEFSATAKYVNLSGNFHDDLQKVRQLSEIANTNLQSVFELILQTGKHYNVDPNDMPTHLIVVSDMQFDAATRPNGYNRISKSNGYTAIETMTKMYNDAGYTIPHVIFWNVTTGKAKPVFNDDKGVTLLSGWSGDILNYLFTGEYNEEEQLALTPYEQMMKIIDHEDYAMIDW